MYKASLKDKKNLRSWKRAIERRGKLMAHHQIWWWKDKIPRASSIKKMKRGASIKTT